MGFVRNRILVHYVLHAVDYSISCYINTIAIVQIVVVHNIMLQYIFAIN